MRLLLVEDERSLARAVRKGLEELSWTVDVASNVESAWDFLRASPPAIVILDLGLPGPDGMELLRRIRGAEMDVPVLILTARGGIEDRVGGLNAGADDYLGKPFAFAELVARLHALQRRGGDRRATILRVADLELDVIRRLALRAGRRIELTAREFNVLEYLMRHADEVVTRPMLAEHVWGDHYDSLSNLIEVFINRLRRKIEHDGTPRLLQTIRGAGYVLREESR